MHSTWVNERVNERGMELTDGRRDKISTERDRDDFASQTGLGMEVLDCILQGMSLK